MRLVIALSAALLVELAAEVWPRVYPCLDREARQRSVRHLTLLPLVALAAVVVAPDGLSLALVCTFGWAGALDLDHHNIGLPVQVLLVSLALASAWGHQWRLLSGVILGGGCLVITLAFEVATTLQARAQRRAQVAASAGGTDTSVAPLAVAAVSSSWLQGYRPPGLGDASVFAAVGLSVGAMQLAVLTLAVIMLGISEWRLGKNQATGTVAQAPLAFYLAAALLLVLVCLHVLPTQP